MFECSQLFESFNCLSVALLYIPRIREFPFNRFDLNLGRAPLHGCLTIYSLDIGLNLLVVKLAAQLAKSRNEDRILGGVI